MAFSEYFLQEVTDRNELTDLVGAYVSLKQRGGSYWACCPFHSEKTPSFHIDPDKQLYYCFGCGKGGGVIQFVMEIENLSFPDAVAFLANRAGLELPDSPQDARQQQRSRLLSLNKSAARFYYCQLSQPWGQAAVDYIRRRGISPKTAKQFGLGCAPDRWDALTHAMKAEGYSEEELLQAGLVKANSRGSGVYDTFRNRLMFPVIDVRGAVIGFSGRILDGSGPKYMNSPETILFNKSRNLFGMNLAKKTKRGYMILVEGNIDVVSLHQAGFDCAVASLGTSLTEEQARLLGRYVRELVLAYDSDAAGQKASQRAIGILEKLEINVRILQIPEGKDPDEFIQRRGRDAFQNLLEKTEDHVSYRLQRVRERYNLDVPKEKADCIRESAAVIAELPNKLDRAVQTLELAQRMSVPQNVLEEEVERIRGRLKSRAKASFERSVSRPERREDIRWAGQEHPDQRRAIAEEGLIRLYYDEPGLFQGERLEPEDFSSPVLGKFYGALREQTRQSSKPSLSTLGAIFSGEEMSRLTALVQKPETASHERREQALKDYIEIVRSEQKSVSQDDDLKVLAEQKRKTKRYGG